MKIDKNIPIPPIMAKYPIRQLQPGESMAVALEDKAHVQTQASRYKKKYGEVYVVRKQRDGVRVWRVAE